MNGLLRQSQLFIKRHGATILTCMGGAGVIATSIMAVKATPKALRLMEEAEREKGDKLTKLEVVKTTGRVYVPSAITAIGTIACIFGANSMNKKRQAALVSAYALIDNSYKQYKNKLIELHGKETHEEILNSIAIEEARNVNVNASSLCANTSLTFDDLCSDPILFYDEYGNRYFETTVEQVLTAEYHLNRNFVLRGFVTLNEFYDFLGLDTTDYGDEVGWTVEDGLYWIDFDHRKVELEDGLECYVIDIPWGPSTDWKENYYW